MVGRGDGYQPGSDTEDRLMVVAFVAWEGCLFDVFRSLGDYHAGVNSEMGPAEKIVSQREQRRDDFYLGQTTNMELGQAPLAGQGVDAFGGRG